MEPLMRRTFALIVSVCLVTAPRPLAAGKEPWTRVSLLSAPATLAVTMSLNGAVDWLADERCQQVFTDFRDQEGRPLADKLAAMHMDGPAYMRLIVWRDGLYTPQCEAGPLAYTMPNSRVVFICTRQFAAFTLADPNGGRAVVLHEALHSLGLGENPPTSLEITRRVRARCQGNGKVK
jgi:hypothetical protein